MKLKADFYLQEDVVAIARELLGCTIHTLIDSQLCSATIAETEAYAGIVDKASHAYGNRYTKRTAVMYRQGGVAYVYLCYGIHNLFNIVTAREGKPHAVLIRGAIPVTNHLTMRKRLGINEKKALLLNGPGKFSKAMGINLTHNGVQLTGNQIWLEKPAKHFHKSSIMCSQRIGIGYAAEDASLPYRFFIKDYQ